MVNIRDQCSWVHMKETDRATEKAKELVRMAVAKSALLEPQQDIESSLVRRAVVIGGGVAGMSAAEAMAGMGMEVVLVEKEAQLGGLLRSLNQLGPEGIPASERVEQLVRSVEEKSNITLHLQSEVTSVGGYIGNYQLTIQPSSGQTVQETAGCIVVATGAVPWIPQSGEYGYGNERVLTQLELEQLLADESYTPPERVVILQCAGARCEERPYCSRICCLTGVKNALLIKERNPETEVHILYRDMQMYGTEKESMLWEARGKGIAFHVYDPDQGVNVQPDRVLFHDSLMGEDREIPFDTAVLSTPLVARANARQISQMMRVPTDQNAFFLEAHAKLRPLDFAADGIFVCGSARYPATVEEARSQGMGVASRIGTILFKEKLISSAIVAEIDPESCVGCLGCVQVCPYQAISYDPQLGVCRVNEILCKGCGNCASSCPSHSVQLRGYKPDQLFSQIRALAEE
jgi:heterodisulfide reductase subunit A